jgi:hypothetical protein
MWRVREIRRVLAFDEFKEEQHPRKPKGAGGGQFAKGAGGGGGGPAAEPAPGFCMSRPARH